MAGRKSHPRIFPYGKMRVASDLGKAIRAARKRRRLTQEDVALASGVGVRFVHDLENGKPSVELGRALRVADAVGLEVRFDDRASA